MGKVSEAVSDIEDLYNMGFSSPEISRRLNLAVFFVEQVVAELSGDVEEEERHPWQN
jgi:hypothetical protein